MARRTVTAPLRHPFRSSPQCGRNGPPRTVRQPVAATPTKDRPVQAGCLSTLAQPSCFGFLLLIGLLILACSVHDLTQ